MNVKIETYRGFDILFETDSERFSFNLDEGSWRQKQSYSACKKNIDDYLKENQNFKPFELESTTHPWEKITVTGIRKDGRFVIEKDGIKDQLSTYDETI